MTLKESPGASPVTGRSDRRAGTSPRRRSGRPGAGTLATFIAPGLMLFLLFVIVPVLFAAYVAFFRWNGLGGVPTDFVGLENFRNLLQDEVFLGDLWRLGLIVVLSLAVQLPLSFGLAMLLHQRFPGRTAFRLLFFVPYVLTEAVTAVLFRLVLSPNRGFADSLLATVGIDTHIGWLSDRNIVMFVIFGILTWKFFGFHMILFLAGRQNIPDELYEAAAIDGATGAQAFRSITLPLMGPTVRMIVFLSIIGSVQLFDLVYVLTGGGPFHASETLAITMYEQGFQRNQIGYASALSIAMFLISLVFALLYQRFVLNRDLQGSLTNAGGNR
ncbi:carbohydrate ABC transporter permease [Glycomyces harbinensis]|uniref:Raffinose/stachyose/melibiose transport system permease protein n=1 Tax=Glycomyces harbinensis TaxID=58114 RepID=A0A1G6YJ37_9ACTN|nr:sugar ABC transporter permease [Glycomyces harbinensis]SDD90013.1 raffinose/stachyose/melibiose transport system permease protein [Glycomyces harbinensis]